MIIAPLGLHLEFSAKLRIWQVSACKMEPQSGTIITAPPNLLMIQGLHDRLFKASIAPSTRIFWQIKGNIAFGRTIQTLLFLAAIAAQYINRLQLEPDSRAGTRNKTVFQFQLAGT